MIRFRNHPIRPCCTAMADVLSDLDMGKLIVFDPDQPLGSRNRFSILLNGGNCIPLLYCPSCGKMIEEVRG